VSAGRITVNGREYRTPGIRSAVVCIDGCDPTYVDDALERRLVPRIAEMLQDGRYAVGASQIPSFTNPNNLSIVTGAPPVVHGVPGNHYLAPDGREVQLTDPAMLRAPTIHARFAAAGVPVLAVTTKDKLRRLLAADGVPCYSAERAHEQALPGHEASLAEMLGTPNPGIYEWDCSHYALELALWLAERLGIVLLYVSLTDFVQHAEPPGGALSDRYWRRLDLLVGRYLDAGWRLALVADHGMNAKVTRDGAPNVRYLADALDAAGVRGARVVLPITDPYVVHHAALGSACWVHVAEDERAAARSAVAAQRGVEEVIDRDAAAARFELPADRIGDLFVLADRDTALGGRAGAHDLASLAGPLRSHGGLHERAVPILLSRPTTSAGDAVLAAGASNADAHHLLLNETR
jgi:phosphonoacetate hydrolase